MFESLLEGPRNFRELVQTTLRIKIRQCYARRCEGVKMIVLGILGALYFLPTIVASNRGHGVAGVLLTNGLVGWTGIGWIALLLWAMLSWPPYRVYPAPGVYCYPPNRYPPNYPANYPPNYPSNYNPPSYYPPNQGRG
jgi:hypothetical protein